MKKFRFLLGFILIYVFAISANAASQLIPGGQVIGLQLQDGSVSVAAFHQELGENAKKAGLREGDRILRINDTPICRAEDISAALSGCGSKVRITVLREGKTKVLTLQPTATDEGPKLGVYLKQGITGVGTVTFYDPEKGTFAALGHGVNTKNGNLLSMDTGNIYAATVQSVKKGKVGTPGQLMGQLTDRSALGTIAKNTRQGVFGTLPAPKTENTLPTATAQEVRTGAATIRSTVGGSTLREYSVEILKIYPNSGERTKNLLLKVTDPALLETTGGIVQGMGVSYNKDNQWNP
ncbi:MAG: PDZ domain-containing protein [Oscillospiraceae bacterium]|nr:PDZ domain-containing protein [Oscillospiraceae bacterium]